MLLRASRSAGHLTKEALIGTGLRALTRFTGGVGRGLIKSPAASRGISGKLGRGVGGFARRNWKLLAGAGFVGATAAPAIAQGYQQARVGLDPGYIQAQQQGYAPAMRARF